MRIVFTPWGSLGDLHPYLAIAIEMKRRGHDAVVATSEMYRAKVEGEGLEFRPVRPDLQRFVENPELIGDVMHSFRGPERIFRGILMPAIRDTFHDIRLAARGADLLVSHVASPATPVVAELLSIPWISIVLQPALFWSVYDPPVYPLTGEWVRLSPGLTRASFGLARKTTDRWMKPLYALRNELGLPVKGKNPIFEGLSSPHGTVALFSPVFAAPQPDWPSGVNVTGFPFYDALAPNSRGLPQDVEEFLAAGEPPVVFTLGSSAVHVPGDFYEVSLQAVKKLGLRAILLAGLEYRKRTKLQSTRDVLVSEYAPYSLLFPRAAATVHSGGIGTTAQSLRSGRPTIVMPFSHDQPDNGARVKRLGVGTVIPRRRYRPVRVANEIEQLLLNTSVNAKAAEVAKQIEAEQGIRAGADALEAKNLKRNPLVARP